MHWLPRTSGERLLLAALCSVAGHMSLWLYLDALPPQKNAVITLQLRLSPPSQAAARSPRPDVLAAVPALPPLAAAQPAVAPPVSPPAGNAAPGEAGEAAGRETATTSAMPRFYTAAELDKLAQPLMPVILPDTDTLPDGVELQVYIDADGTVLRVEVPDSVPPDYAVMVRQRFLGAGFSPAEKDGVPVASVKRIALSAEDL